MKLTNSRLIDQRDSKSKKEKLREDQLPHLEEKRPMVPNAQRRYIQYHTDTKSSSQTLDFE